LHAGGGHFTRMAVACAITSGADERFRNSGLIMLQRVFRLPKQLFSIWRHPMNRGREIAAIHRWLSWQIASRLSPGPIIVPFVGNTHLVARSGETGVTGNIFYGLAEYEDMAFTVNLLRPGDLFIDIGANAGAYTVLASGVAGAFAEAFEPIPSTADRLELNICLNGLEKLVVIHRTGVGSQAGTLRFTMIEDTVNHVANENEPAEELPIETIDNMLELKAPTLMKIDVEGFEPEVLAGAKKTLNASSLLALVVEINSSYERYGYQLRDVVGPLSDAGFQPFGYQPGTRTLFRLSTTHSTSGNTIFIKDERAVKERLAAAPAIPLHC
jgi:FkbM family methyltransferase